MTRAIAALFCVLLACGCVFGPAVECDDADWQPGLMCDAVIAAARTELEATRGVMKLTAERFIPCPAPPAGCPFHPFEVAVYADLIGGGQVYVTVDLEGDGSLRTRPPQPVEAGP